MGPDTGIAHTKRMIAEIASPTHANSQMQVFDLRDQDGEFETSSIGFPVGTRSFGFWSFLTPRKGDLVVIKRPLGIVCYIITKVDHKETFAGSDTNRFWFGTMDDIVKKKLETSEIEGALKAANCI